MGNKNKGNAQALLQFTKLILHVCPQFQVKGRQGLIQEDYSRFIDNRPCNSHPLALTTRKFLDRAFLKASQLYHFKDFCHSFLNFRLVYLLQTKGEGNILKHIHVWEKGIRLEDSMDIPFVGRYIIDPNTIQEDISCRSI